MSDETDLTQVESPLGRSFLQSRKSLELGNIKEPSSADTSFLSEWLQGISFSKPIKNNTRDFSDGVLMAELLANYFPRHVELHCYQKASSTKNKKANWEMLNRKVFAKLGFILPNWLIDNICQCRKGAVNKVLVHIHSIVIKMIEDEELRKAEEQMRSVRDEESFIQTREAVCLLQVKSEDEMPKKIIYKGYHFLPSFLLDEKSARINELEDQQKMLNNKIRRLETMITLKEERLEDLTGEVQHLRVQVLDNLPANKCFDDNKEEGLNDYLARHF